MKRSTKTKSKTKKPSLQSQIKSLEIRLAQVEFKTAVAVRNAYNAAFYSRQVKEALTTGHMVEVAS